MAFGAGDYIVDKHTNLVAQALIILFVALSEDHLEGCFERWNDFFMDRELKDGFFTANFDKVP